MSEHRPPALRRWARLADRLVSLLLVVLPAALVAVVACTALWQLRRRPRLGRAEYSATSA